MFDIKNTYWNGAGKYREFVDGLEDRIPMMGYTSNVYVNIYLVMAHLYYDAYNNGGGNIEDNYAGEFVARVESYLGDKVALLPFLDDDFEKMESMMDHAIEFIKDKNLEFPVYTKWCNHDERVISDIKPSGNLANKGYWFEATFGEPEELYKFVRGYKDITGEFKDREVEVSLESVIGKCENMVDDSKVPKAEDREPERG